MASSPNNKSIIIIGAGFAGMAAGIYARLNGYKTTIYEMHSQPGGLCTSWNRKGYTFDCCIHWLVGSSPSSGMHDMWEETGIVQNRKIIDHDEYMRLEGPDGRTLVFYTNVDRLEKHLLEFSPQDEKPIRELIAGIRMCIPFDTASKHDSLLTRTEKQSRNILNFVLKGKKMQEWMKITCKEFSGKFKDPLIRLAINEMWIPDFSILFILFTMAYLHNRNAGYPIGGSLPMSLAMEARYTELGGAICYRQKVTRILTEADEASGIELEDGTKQYADRVISAADGYATLYKMLEGKYGDARTREPYEKWPVFPSLIYVSLGINRRFNDVPQSVSGLTFHLKEPVEIGDYHRDKLSVHIYNHDPSMAPEGKTAITLMLKTGYEYWKKIAEDRTSYIKKKEEIGNKVVELLEQRFPGITSQVEVIDVATPLTFERYTGNWKGCFEGWLITPENSKVMMKPMSQSVPGIKKFYMCGQWVEPGGGLPTAVMSGRRLVKRICREDGKRFRTG